MSDMLPQYRKRGVQQAPDNPGGVAAPARQPAPQPVSARQEEYEAFRSSAHPLFTLEIRLHAGAASCIHSPEYSLCRNRVTDGFGQFIGLNFGHMTVEIQGRNLEGLFRKLREREVDWIEEYDPRLWPAPAEDAPCITALVVKFKQEEQPATDSTRH